MRAEEFRTKADNCEYQQTRDSLRKVAENYQTLARQAQRILNADQANERRRLEALQVTQEPELILSGSHGAP
jgi:thymidylate kinase